MGIDKMIKIIKGKVQGYKNASVLAEDLIGEKGDMDKIMEESLDSTFLMDANLESLVDYLEEGDFTKEKVKEMLNARYGDILEFYHLEEEDMYVMEIGAR